MDTQLANEGIKFLGIALFKQRDFFELIIRFGLNFIVIGIIVRFLYYPLTKRKDYLFTYILISSIIFLLCYLLGNVKIQMGFALGLFAIFGIIRYRTNPMPIKEMTYLFVIIGISVINALTNKKISYSELLFTNLIIIALIYCLEKLWLLKHESCKIITYEKIALIKPEKQNELIDDLKERTGLNINRIEIGKINFLRDSAQISIYYYSEGNHINLTDENENYNAGGDDDE